MELVDIHPQLLKFIFELNKQSTCTIQVTNKSEHYVAFKVKTTCPKKYCVKPNIGVVKPKGTYEFTVVMQAQSSAPSDLLCKDKFLVQCTVVPFGLTEENITSDMFVKDSIKHIEEKKMKVILVGPSEPPVQLPVNGMPIDVSVQDKSQGVSPIQKDAEGSQMVKAAEEQRLSGNAERRPAMEEADRQIIGNAKPRELMKLDEEKIGDHGVGSNLRNDVQELTLKLNDMRSKLTQAEETVAQLNEEKNRVLHDKGLVEQEVETARRKNVVKKVYVGYPFLYVCLVALISLIFGYLSHQ